MNIDDLVTFLRVIFGDVFMYLAGMFVAALLGFEIIGMAVDAITGGDRVNEGTSGRTPDPNSSGRR